jgi:hypothetical protein
MHLVSLRFGHDKRSLANDSHLSDELIELEIPYHPAYGRCLRSVFCCQRNIEVNASSKQTFPGETRLGTETQTQLFECNVKWPRPASFVSANTSTSPGRNIYPGPPPLLCRVTAAVIPSNLATARLSAAVTQLMKGVAESNRKSPLAP